MKSYKSFLAEKLEEFIAYREHLWIRNRNSRSLLAVFDQYVIQQKRIGLILPLGFSWNFRAKYQAVIEQ